MSLNSSVEFSTTVAGRKLLTSGAVHIEGDYPIDIQIANLKFVFNFKNDEGDPRYTGTVNDNAVYFDLFNHKNSLGEGKLTPIVIGKLGEQTLSFTYFVNTVNVDANARRFEYAFYVEDAK